MIWKKRGTLEDLAKRNLNSMGEHLGIEFIEIGDDFLSARMPVDHRTLQPFGIMHGGASCVLAETLGSVAASLTIDTATQVCMGAEINTSHIRPISSGWVIGTAKPLHLGKTTQLWEIPIVNNEGQLISVSRLRIMVVEKRPN